MGLDGWVCACAMPRTCACTLHTGSCLRPCMHSLSARPPPTPTTPAARSNTQDPACPRRRLADVEARLVEEETALRVQQLVDAKVSEVMGSDVVQQTLQRRLEEERKQMEEQVGGEVGGRTGTNSLPSVGPGWVPAHGPLHVRSMCMLCGVPVPRAVALVQPATAQVEAELEAERRAAEEEQARARDAIERHKLELQKLEEEQQAKVRCPKQGALLHSCACCAAGVVQTLVACSGSFVRSCARWAPAGKNCCVDASHCSLTRRRQQRRPRQMRRRRAQRSSGLRSCSGRCGRLRRGGCSGEAG